MTTNDSTTLGTLRLIETDHFPVEFLSAVGERESWRKEVYRPIYHVHKWWAKRLGSIFRGIILGCLEPAGSDLTKTFYKKHDFSGVSVFDPFMGSGTTVGESHKLGCSALGRDINPVACESVRVALGPIDRHRLQEAFGRLSKTVGERIRGLYRSFDDKQRSRDVLYYFWVKQADCPHCDKPVDLFSSRVFARNAYPDRKPEVQICCPGCGDVFPAHNRDESVRCHTCDLQFAPQLGTASGTSATCTHCLQPFKIAEAVRAKSGPPSHRLYAKLLLLPDGTKRYLPTTADDMDACRKCSDLLRDEVECGKIRLPIGELSDGYNTRQAMGYNYRHWRDFFNDRQLLALGWLHQAISELTDTSTRDALSTLFSGVLEFNNVFASYKGEGTGAVRHMFSHHILKPERMPIEANVWGTPKSSGSFLNLFSSRLVRALDYRDAPFEVTVEGEGKAYESSLPFSGCVETNWPTKGRFQNRVIYLSSGSSDATQLPDQSIDFVITDPPFFDNVHYSELADFFYAWQSLYPRGFLNGAATTRHPHEVQDSNSDQFAKKLEAVFTECHRVLKREGLLAFTYHHSRPEGWTSLVKAIYGSGFSVVNTHPVKAELSLATPKSQAKEPIQLDVVFVCRKRERDTRPTPEPETLLDEAASRTLEKLTRLTSLGLKLSENDVRVAMFSQFISMLGPIHAPNVAANILSGFRMQLELTAQEFTRQLLVQHSNRSDFRPEPRQMSLFS